MKKNPLYIISILLFIVGLLTLSYVFGGGPKDEIPLPDTGAKLELDANRAYPTELSIPKLGINTNIVEVGVTPGGNMGVPNNYTDVGWYKYGTLPGNIGSAVLAGHVNNRWSLPAVFYDLPKLENGDEIFVTTETGETLKFVVSEKNIYDFDAKAPEVFNDSSGRLLKLITCTGTWVKEFRTHDKRLVVTAKLVE